MMQPLWKTLNIPIFWFIKGLEQEYSYQVYSNGPKVESVKNINQALTCVAQLVEHRLVKQKVAGLIPSQGTCLGCGPLPNGGVCERQPINISFTHQCVSPSLPPSLPLSLKNK